MASTKGQAVLLISLLVLFTLFQDSEARIGIKDDSFQCYEICLSKYCGMGKGYASCVEWCRKECLSVHHFGFGMKSIPKGVKNQQNVATSTNGGS